MKTKDITQIPILIRKAIEPDVAFIFNSWLRSYRDSYFAKGIAATVYFTEHHKVIEQLLKTCTVYIACDSTDTSNIFGYICAEEIDGIFVIHYTYVKETYRKLGVSKMLVKYFGVELGEKASIYTHKTKIGNAIAEKKHCIYSPYVAFTSEYRNKEGINESGNKKG
jgi:GNAT superfamily N-acetyltransferase